MRESKQTALALGLVAVFPGGLLAQPAPPGDAQVQTRVEALLARMTLEDKARQLTQAGGIAFDGAPDPEEASARRAHPPRARAGQGAHRALAIYSPPACSGSG